MIRGDIKWMLLYEIRFVSFVVLWRLFKPGVDHIPVKE